MKKIILLGMFVFVSLFMTGCTKCTYEFEIDNKDNIIITETQAIDKTALLKEEPGVQKALRESLENYISKLKTVSDIVLYENDEYLGIRSVKKASAKNILFQNLPVGFEKSRTGDEESIITIKDGFFKKTYIINLSFNTKKSLFVKERMSYDIFSKNDYIKEKTELETNEYGYQVDPLSVARKTITSIGKNNPQKENINEIIIKTPRKTTKHNATYVVSRKEYKWVATGDKPISINIEFSKIKWVQVISTVLLLMVLTMGAIKVYKYNNIVE